MPTIRRYEQIGDPTVADGILDRLVPQRKSSRDARRLDAKKSGQAADLIVLDVGRGRGCG